MRDEVHDLTVPVELLIEAATGYNEPEITETYVCVMRIIFSDKQRLYLGRYWYYEKSSTSNTYLYQTRTIRRSSSLSQTSMETISPTTNSSGLLRFLSFSI